MINSRFATVNWRFERHGKVKMSTERTTGVHQGEKPDPTFNHVDEAIVGHSSVSSKRGVAEDGSELHKWYMDTFISRWVIRSFPVMWSSLGKVPAWVSWGWWVYFCPNIVSNEAVGCTGMRFLPWFCELRFLTTLYSPVLMIWCQDNLLSMWFLAGSLLPSTQSIWAVSPSPQGTHPHL